MTKTSPSKSPFIKLPLILVLCLIALISGGVFYWQKTAGSNQPQLLGQANPATMMEMKAEPGQSDQSQSALTQSEFASLTIPYLRQLEFSSQLAQRTLLASQPNYTSYLTSYESDGLTINGLLTIPNGAEPAGGWPAVVFVHGYIPPAQYQTTSKYESYVDSLASSGLVVFKIDLRGHGQSEGEAKGAYYAGDYIIDTLNAYAALQKSDFVNPERVGLWGHSMGGNVVLRSLAVKPDIPAAVIWAGSVFTYDDLAQHGISDNSYRRPSNDSTRNQERARLFEQHGRFDTASPFWQQVSPTNYLDQIKTAIQLHHATNDDVVNVGYSQNLARLLEQQQREYEFFEYQTGGHNITGPSFSQAMQRTINFYQQQL